VSAITTWRDDFLEFLKTAHPELRTLLRDNRLDRKFPSDEVKNALVSAIKEFKATSNYS